MADVTPPVVVVGGGVIGLCVAYSLVQRGVEVCVVDWRTELPPASWGNAGWVTPALSAPVPAPGVVRYGLRSLAHPSSPLRITPRADPRLAGWLLSFARHCTEAANRDGFEATIRLARGTFDRYDDLARNGVEFELRNSGLTFIALDRPTAQSALEQMRPIDQHGYRLPAHVLDGEELQAQEPALSAAVEAGFHVAEERHVDPRTLLAGLRSWLDAHGVSFRTGDPVRRCVVADGRATGVALAGGDVVPAASVVLAAGAWTGALAGPLGCRIPMQGGKGYSFSAEVTPQVSQPYYLLEAKTGITPFGSRTRAAGTMEFDGLRPRVKPGRLTAIRTAASRYLHGWDKVPMDEPWAGLRPMTPDGLPVIGRLPATANVYVATGHAMLGVTLGPATGDHLARLIVDGEASPVLGPFAPDRFRRIRLPRNHVPRGELS